MQRVITPLTTLIVTVLAVLFAVGGWIGTAVQVACRLWPDRIGNATSETLVGSIVWALACTFGAFAMIRYRKRFRRSRAGLCRTCGYDLRATPERCPECGAISKHKETEGIVNG